MYQVQQEKMNQVIDHLQQLDIDAWLIYTSEGSDPCIPLVTGVGTVGPGVFMVTKDRQKFALCSSIDAQDIEESRLFDKVYKHDGNLAGLLTGVISEMKPNKIALNFSVEEHLADGLTAGRYRWLTRTLCEVFKGEIVSSETFLSSIRSIKTKTEINRIEQAINITEEIYSTVFQRMKIGMSERALGKLFVEEMEKRHVVNGIDRKLSMPIVLKENVAHREPGEAVVKGGDLVIFDFSVDVEGYVSDIARTVYFLKEGESEPPDHIHQAFQSVHEAISMAGAAIKPGAKGYEVDDAARRFYLSQGFPEISHATGHQIGRDVHDGGILLGPKWERYGAAPLGEVKEGMVFTIEPTLFLDNGIHFIVEENVVVTSEGIRYLTTRQNELILIPFSKEREEKEVEKVSD
ncbi:M24 family metallopeptidase [Pseudalkalibacillus hwajinpoensis]|uniref:M24 family metallopeptidase n=1 Tax=Guptibacillus hwajinpoensis TaxID=208199 RepID=UPI001CD7A519|nr:Xaa-Pro peptidase family protein [Pseudalkalibacillus hwajinpoensis]MCA0991977.1 Xaa-Pro peptidase family protein [Pseudalkalibacillus hwajinpoensis]